MGLVVPSSSYELGSMVSLMGSLTWRPLIDDMELPRLLLVSFDLAYSLGRRKFISRW